jgi:hypothetical protein
MCHFPNPDIALRKAFRVLKVGGRIAFTVWDKRAVGFGAVYAAIRAHGSLDVDLPAGPNFFLLSDPETGHESAANCGLRLAVLSSGTTSVARQEPNLIYRPDWRSRKTQRPGEPRAIKHVAARSRL